MFLCWDDSSWQLTTTPEGRWVMRTADEVSFSARLGLEIFEDASRAQTTGQFNNSCASCHFEGGEDGNVWQQCPKRGDCQRKKRK